MLVRHCSWLKYAGFVVGLGGLCACHGQNKMYQPVSAERYFTDSPALTVALACQHDDPAALRQALAATHVSPNEVGEKGMSLLMLALRNRSKQAMRLLLTQGADPNLQTRLSAAAVPVQPVAMAAGGDDTELLTILLDHGGDPNSRFGGTPAVFGAADHERFDQMRLLLDHGADINGVNKEGYPLVVYLAGMRNFDQVVYLIERGADIYKPTSLGYTLGFRLQEEGFEYPPSYSRYQDVVKAKHLLEAKGIRFPVVSPAVAHTAQERVENAQRRQWEATAEGRRLLGPIRAAEQERARSQNTTQNYAYSQDLRLKAEEAFQAWRKSQPNWVPSVNFVSNYYEDAPSLAEEEADMKQRQAKFQADSVRWAEQAKALH